MIKLRGPDTLRALAQTAEAQGRMADAIAFLREAAETAPRFAIAHAEWAQLLQRAGRPGEALHLLDARIRQFPEAAWPLSIKAALLDTERRTEESLPVHKQIVDRIPHRNARLRKSSTCGSMPISATWTRGSRSCRLPRMPRIGSWRRI